MAKQDKIPPAAKRALEEAEERRKAIKDKITPKKEFGGRDGPEPVLSLIHISEPTRPY